MIKNSLFLYKTLNNQLLNDLNVEILETVFSYNDKSDVTELTLEEDELYKYYLGTVPEYWEPSEKNLNIHRTLKLNNVELLFGSGGIANGESKIGIGAKI